MFLTSQHDIIVEEVGLALHLFHLELLVVVLLPVIFLRVTVLTFGRALIFYGAVVFKVRDY